MQHKNESKTRRGKGEEGRGEKGRVLHSNNW